MQTYNLQLSAYSSPITSSSWTIVRSSNELPPILYGVVVCELFVERKMLSRNWGRANNLFSIILLNSGVLMNVKFEIYILFFFLFKMRVTSLCCLNYRGWDICSRMKLETLEKRKSARFHRPHPLFFDSHSSN